MHSNDNDYPSLLMSLEARINALEREALTSIRAATPADIADVKKMIGEISIKQARLEERIDKTKAEVRKEIHSFSTYEGMLKAVASIINERLDEVQADYNGKIANLRALIGDTVASADRASKAAATATYDSLISFSEDFAYGSVRN